jgi:nucleotide-binding universal stress UspA family protein
MTRAAPRAGDPGLRRSPARAGAAVWPFARVLVPLDGSELALKVLGTVEALVAHGATEVTLLRVVEPRSAHDQDPGPAAELVHERQADEARERLGPDVRVRVELARGAAADEVVRFARATGQDLIAMSTHGRSGPGRWLRGSVAEAVLRTTDVPLLLCNPVALERPAGRGFERILVPLDGSAHAEAVLPSVERVAAACDALVTLLIVEPLAVTELPAPVVAAPWDPAAQALRLRPVVERLEQKGLRADADAACGGVVAGVLQAAADADLLAMTTHGRSGLSRLWSGSVAEQVLREARCPLLVVRAPGP